MSQLKNDTDPFLAYLRNNRQRHLDELIAFLRIPSVSALPEHKSDVRAAATAVARKLRDIRLTAELIEGKDGDHPLVIGAWNGAPGKPTVLLYAHYDVQPAEPFDKWLTPPFEPSIRNGLLYARGAADDKGQLWILLAALESFLATSRQLPVNIKVLFEGEEESGGTHVERYVCARPDFLNDVTSVLVLDSAMVADGLPPITNGLRGIITADLVVTTLKGDQHSGMEGGVAPNAAEALALIIAEFKTDSGRVRIPGFYKDVQKPTALELDSWRSLHFNEEAHRLALGTN